VGPEDDNRDACLAILERQPVLGGRFRNIRRLGPFGGGGAFSLLLSAEDTETKATVALKVFRPDKLHETYRLECFEREARILGELRGQQDIVTSLSPRLEFKATLRSQEGIPFPLPFYYYAMEFAQMGDAEAAIDRKAWDADTALVNFRSMCRAVQRIHTRRIAHRDLKPGNFLVMKDGTIKLGDFGTSRSFGQGAAPLLTSYAGRPPGDLRFMAPEVLAGLQDDDPRTDFGGDLFSLGAILFQLFTGAVLVLQVLGADFYADLLGHMAAIPSKDRKRIFDQVVGSISDSHRLPSVKEFGDTAPASIRDRIDDLYRQTACLDYRRRLTDFQTIFNKVNVCLQVLRNEERYRKWNEARRRRMAARAEATRTEVSS